MNEIDLELLGKLLKLSAEADKSEDFRGHWDKAHDALLRMVQIAKELDDKDLIGFLSAAHSELMSIGQYMRDKAGERIEKAKELDPAKKDAK